MTTFRTLSTVAVMALALSACGSQASTGGDQASPSQPAATITVTAAAPSTTGEPTSGSTAQQESAPASAPSATVAGATRSAAATQDSHTITYQGIGSLRLGATVTELTKADVVEKSPSCEKSWDVVNGKGTYDLSFRDEKLTAIWTKQRDVRTAEGAGVGTTFAELQKLYGKGYLVLPVNAGENLKVDVAQITDGERSIYFGAVDSAGEWTDAKPSSTVGWMSVQDYLADPVFGC